MKAYGKGKVSEIVDKAGLHHCCDVKVTETSDLLTFCHHGMLDAEGRSFTSPTAGILYSVKCPSDSFVSDGVQCSSKPELGCAQEERVQFIWGVEKDARVQPTVRTDMGMRGAEEAERHDRAFPHSLPEGVEGHAEGCAFGETNGAMPRPIQKKLHPTDPEGISLRRRERTIQGRRKKPLAPYAQSGDGQLDLTFSQEPPVESFPMRRNSWIAYAGNTDGIVASGIATC